MTLHIHRVPTREIRREHVGDKWCFHCRARLPHDAVTRAPIDLNSYYGPHWLYECSRCGLDRVDFPGTLSEREFVEGTA